jgi:hypothetical protein
MEFNKISMILKEIKYYNLTKQEDIREALRIWKILVYESHPPFGKTTDCGDE